MIKTSSKQTGSAHVVIIVILIIALIGTLGFVFWQNFIDKKDVVSTETDKSINKPKADTLTYRSDAIGIEFNYPKNWIKLACDNTYVENPESQVFFGTTNEGLAIVDGKSTQLCGGGSDFPPQMFFNIAANNEEYTQHGRDSSFTNVKIDNKDARKSITVAGSDTIMPGLETTKYVIDISSTQHITFGYNRYLETTDSLRDNTEESRQKFIDVVEKSLRFL